MAAPYQVYGPRWEVALTASMAAEIRLAAAESGVSRAEWIREACAQRLAREQRSQRRRTEVRS